MARHAHSHQEMMQSGPNEDYTLSYRFGPAHLPMLLILAVGLAFCGKSTPSTQTMAGMDAQDQMCRLDLMRPAAHAPVVLNATRRHTPTAMWRAGKPMGVTSRLSQLIAANYTSLLGRSLLPTDQRRPSLHAFNCQMVNW